MIPLIILNCTLIVVIVITIVILRKFLLSEKQIHILFLVAPILTILCHYSSIIYHLFTEGTAYNYLLSNPNLVLPIYPCNVVMWCCMVYPFVKKEKIRHFLADFIFLFGIASCLVGLFANVDFIRNPSLADYDVTKGILAHAFMLFNVLIFAPFKEYKLDLNRNMPNMCLGIIMMGILGVYCNLLIAVLDSKEYAYSVNSMFLLHSPFEGIDFLIYPVIAVAGLILYYVVLHIVELVKYEKGNRWFNRISHLKNK